MTDKTSNLFPASRRRDGAVLGVACCVASALGYTVVNAFKRLLTVHCDRPMMLCVQDSVSVVVVGAWLIAVACLAGLVYAATGAALRKILIGGFPLAVVLFVVPAVGAAALAPISLYRLGLSGILETRLPDLGIMAAAGVLNLLAYLACLQGLRLISVLNANVLSASQVAMAAVAGFVLFGEQAGLGLTLGVVLTVIGMILSKPPASPKEACGTSRLRRKTRKSL